MLDAAGVRKHRSLVMRAAYLSLDRPDISEATKTLCRSMQFPTSADEAAVKRLGRYLVKHRCLVSTFGPQQMPSEISIVVDSDHAGCALSRKSTSGTVAMFGGHVLKAHSTLQSTISLSSGESEFYAIVKGASLGLMIQALAQDLGYKSLSVGVRGAVDFPITIASDSSAARAFAERKGLGRQKHVQTRFLWVQDAVQKRRVQLRTVLTTKNVADMLTKCVPASVARRHLGTMGYKFRDVWSNLHRRLGK